MGLEVGLAHQLVDGHDAEHGGLPHTALNVVIRLGEIKIYPFLVYKTKRVRATLESSSKRGSFNRISNRQEFWSIEIGHLTYNMGIGHWGF